jgi:hypothetical protein
LALLDFITLVFWDGGIFIIMLEGQNSDLDFLFWALELLYCTGGTILSVCHAYLAVFSRGSQ